jgi:hypothetical protein
MRRADDTNHPPRPRSGTAKLQQAQNLMAETEAIGVSVLDTMHQQGESLLSSTKKARTCLLHCFRQHYVHYDVSLQHHRACAAAARWGAAAAAIR